MLDFNNHRPSVSPSERILPHSFTVLNVGLTLKPRSIQVVTDRAMPHTSRIAITLLMKQDEPTLLRCGVTSDRQSIHGTLGSAPHRCLSCAVLNIFMFLRLGRSSTKRWDSSTPLSVSRRRSMRLSLSPSTALCANHRSELA